MKAVTSPGTVARFGNDAAVAVGRTSAEYASFIAAEQTRWKEVTASAKIKPDA